MPGANLMRAVSGLEQSRTPQDVMRVAGLLVEWLRDPRDDGLKRAFTDWVWRLAGAIRTGGCGVAGGADVGGCEDDAGRTAGRLHHPHLLGGRPLGGMVTGMSGCMGVADGPLIAPSFDNTRSEPHSQHMR